MFHETELPTIRSLVVPPDPEGTAGMVANFGYSLPEALADLIDNSIDAHATRACVVLFRTDRDVRRIALVDDGEGMTEETLDAAMQLGVRAEHALTDLGKYGCGMKTASLSQCEALTVVTTRAGITSARRWTTKSFGAGFKLEVIDPGRAAKFWKSEWSLARELDHGTIVLWDHLNKLLGDAPERFEKFLASQKKHLASELGLVFHRFIRSERLNLSLQEVNSAGAIGIEERVASVDPFDYDGKSGAPGYPITFRIGSFSGHEVAMEAHIWPPKSASPRYKLGAGGPVKRQGFFFYRNDRLIKAGGWYGYMASDPHASLARIRIDLHPSLSDRNGAFRLRVQKNDCDPPSDFIPRVREAITGTTTFQSYIDQAQLVYRNAPKSQVPIAVPSSGFPKGASTAIRELAGVKRGDPALVKIQLVWRKLESGVVVELELDSDRIVLNTLYRTAIAGVGKKSNDGAAFKALLFLALQNVMILEKNTKSVASTTASLNLVLRSVLESA